MQSSAGIGAELGDHNLAVKYLNPVTLLPSAIGIDSKVSKQEQLEAEDFVKFVLSPAGQKVMLESGDPTGDSLFPGAERRKTAEGAPITERCEDPNHQPLQVGAARTVGQHLVRQHHRQVTRRKTKKRRDRSKPMRSRSSRGGRDG